MIPMCQMFVLEKKLTTKNDIMLHIIKHLALDNKTNKSYSFTRGGGDYICKDMPNMYEYIWLCIFEPSIKPNPPAISL